MKKKLWKAFRKTTLIGAVATVVLFVIYMLNLDMKLVSSIYQLLGKHYDNMVKERRV
jgi:hypothetical protein